jgi:hypothetical protein
MRKARHKQDMQTRTSKLYTFLKAQNWDDVSIILIENFSCTSDAELKAREDYHITLALQDPKCLNTKHSTPVSISESRKEQQRKRDNERRAEKVECECGRIVAKSNLHQHIHSKVHTLALGLPDSKKQLRSERGLEVQRQCASEREKTLIQCECGAQIKYGSLYLHRQSQKHLEAVK